MPEKLVPEIMKEGMSGTVPRVPSALGGYPAAAFRVGTLAAMPEAAIVNLDISSVSGPRAGVSVGGFTNFQFSTLNPELPGRLGIRHCNGGCSGFHAVEGAGMPSMAAVRHRRRASRLRP